MKPNMNKKPFNTGAKADKNHKKSHDLFTSRYVNRFPDLYEKEKKTNDRPQKPL